VVGIGGSGPVGGGDSAGYSATNGFVIYDMSEVTEGIASRNAAFLVLVSWSFLLADDDGVLFGLSWLRGG